MLDEKSKKSKKKTLRLLRTIMVIRRLLSRSVLSQSDITHTNFPFLCHELSSAYGMITFAGQYWGNEGG